MNNSEPISESPRRRILCVEDNKDTCEMIAFIFRDFEVQFASGLAAARRLIETESFELFVLDNWLPDGSGVELCREIRQSGSLAPIVFTSAVGVQKSVNEALDAGANLYFLKPIEPDKLIKAVKELLANAEPKQLSVESC